MSKRKSRKKEFKCHPCRRTFNNKIVFYQHRAEYHSQVHKTVDIESFFNVKGP
jgi:transposase-like protein